MYALKLSKVPVSGTSMKTDVFVIQVVVERWGFAAVEIGRNGDVARIKVFRTGEHPCQCVVVYYMAEKSVEFEGDNEAVVASLKSKLCE